MTEILPPDYLIDAIPGAREALANWQAALDDGRPLHLAAVEASRRHAELAFVAFRRPVPDNDPDGIGLAVYEPRRGVSPMEAGEARAAKERAEMAVESHDRIAKAKLEKFKAIVRDGLGSGEYDEFLRDRARDAHATALASWEQVRSALTERATASEYLGVRGSFWSERFEEDESVDNSWSREIEDQRRVVAARARGYAASKARESLENLDGFVREFSVETRYSGWTVERPQSTTTNVTASA